METTEKQKPKTKFEEDVEREIAEIVGLHRHEHPLYQETAVHGKVIDPEHERAAFVLFEQIDTDRCTPEGEGWLGDQYRYSVWHMQGGKKPKQVYEDHAYMRRSKSELTGSSGRDCSVNLVGLCEDGVIAEISPKKGEGISYSKEKVKITLDGRVTDVEDFADQARNLITRIAPRLGCDYLSSSERLEGRDIMAITFTTENGSTYGYDTVYLVWKGRNGQISHMELANSRSTKDYLGVRGISEDQDDILVKVKDSTYRISKTRLE